MEEQSTTAPQPPSGGWIALEDPKSWSRLLYPNPVCFLCCCPRATDTKVNAEATDSDTKANVEAMATDTDTKANANAMTDTDAKANAMTDTDTKAEAEANTTDTKANAMVLSWMTATNNEGELMFSLNRRRHTAGLLLPTGGEPAGSLLPTDGGDASATDTDRRFVLCVPTIAQKELVLQVGSVSGRDCDVTKFPADGASGGDGSSAASGANGADGSSAAPGANGADGSSAASHLSKRQRRALLRSQGVPGLRRVPLADGRDAKQCDGSTDDGLFYIDGTIAYLVCRVKQHSLLNADHHLVVAQVEEAAVQSSYWNASKRLFVSSDPRRFPPYLTFLGSQTFACVMPVPEEQPSSDLSIKTPSSRVSAGTKRPFSALEEEESLGDGSAKKPAG